MLLISYWSVAGWFKVWSVCVKAQLHVQSSCRPITPPPQHGHTLCMPHFLFLTPLALCLGMGGASGKREGLWQKTRQSTRDVVLTRTNSARIITFVVKALVMRGKRISVHEANLDLLSDHFWGGGGDCEETGGLCFYLRDCNNNHTSATGLVASIILSTVEQTCMGVKTIVVWVCVDACVCVCVILSMCVFERKEGWVKVGMYCGWVCVYLLQQFSRSSTDR